jgi:CRISPR-associated endonuclease Cas3-HD
MNAPEWLNKVSDIIISKAYNDYSETLKSHNDKIKHVISIIKPCFDNKVNFNINKDLLDLATDFHDLGKGESSWYKNKMNKNPLFFRHEVLSFLIAKFSLEEYKFSNIEKLIILMCILQHHSKYISVYDNESNFSVDSSNLFKNNNQKNRMALF